MATSTKSCGLKKKSYHFLSVTHYLPPVLNSIDHQVFMTRLQKSLSKPIVLLLLKSLIRSLSNKIYLSNAGCHWSSTCFTPLHTLSFRITNAIMPFPTFKNLQSLTNILGKRMYGPLQLTSSPHHLLFLTMNLMFQP